MVIKTILLFSGITSQLIYVSQNAEHNCTKDSRGNEVREEIHT
jgi:hypothetical protein